LDLFLLEDPEFLEVLANLVNFGILVMVVEFVE